MKKRILSALLVLCLACGLVSTAWATGQSTPETAAVSVTDAASGETAQEEPLPDETAGEPASDETVEGTAAPVADGTEYTAALDVDGQTLNVIVTAPDGAFAEGVDPLLSVTMLNAEDELNAVADELDAADVQYDGFAAMDITFTDKITGEEIEPAQQVSVRIELPQAIVDSGIDLSTLAVQHLEEDADGNVQNVTEVATLDNGITLSEEAAAAVNEAAGVAPMSDMPAEEATAGDAAETPAAVAEFSVDGFSNFVITWQADWHRDGTIIVTYWNTEGGGSELTVPNQYLFDIGELNDGDSITLQNGKLTVKGREFEIPQQVTVGNDTYKYIGAKCYYDESWQDFTTIRLEAGWGWNYKVDNQGSSSRPDIRLQYEKVSTDPGPGGDQGGTGTASATVTTGKSAVKIGDTDNYTLNLSVSGDRGSEEKTQPVDVLFILDTSGSMDDSYVQYNNQYMTLINALKSVLTGSYNKNAGIGGLIGSIEANQNIDVRYSVVSFAGAKGDKTNGSVVLQQDWTESADSVVNKIRGLSANGGTNYQQGILKGNDQLSKPAHTSRNATTFVVFVTDGEPTFYGTNDQGNGSDFDQTALSRAQTALQDTDCDYFYAIGIGSVFSNEYSNAYKRLDTLKEYVGDNIPGSSTIGRTFAAGDDMTGAFDSILKNITFFEANNVTMVDPLSEYADLVPNASGQYEITLQLEKRTDAGVTYEKVGDPQTVQIDANSTGKTVTLSDGNETVSLTVYVDKGLDDKETIRIEFADNYKLAQNYRYTASTTITPSDTAKQATMDSDDAQKIPDADTGTHADRDEQGFWSNDNANAKVIFDAITTNKDNQIIDTDPGKTALFPKPVIQVTESTGSLRIVKDVQGIDGDVETVVGNTTFTFQLEKVIKTEGIIDEYTRDETFTDSALGFTGGVKTEVITITGEGQSSVISGLPEGWYRITETDTGTVAANSDYEFVSNNGPVVVPVTEANTPAAPAEATITNTYKHKDKVLTVTKQVIGDLAVKGDSFDFTLELQNADGSAYKGDPLVNDSLESMDGSNNKYTFTLTGEEGDNSIRISLPHGVKAIVTETNKSDYTIAESRLDKGNFAEIDNQTATMTADHSIDFRNTKNLVGPPTGLERNDTPYTILVTVAGIAGLALIGGIVARRRRRRME